jgi:hypothetical protein
MPEECIGKNDKQGNKDKIHCPLNWGSGKLELEEDFCELGKVKTRCD